MLETQVAAHFLDDAILQFRKYKALAEGALAQVAEARYGFSVDGGDHVAHAHTRFRCWTAVGDGRDENAGVLRRAEELAELGRQVDHRYTDECTLSRKIEIIEENVSVAHHDGAAAGLVEGEGGRGGDE